MKLLPTLLLLAGCTTLDASQLVPADYATTQRHPYSVRIEADGSSRQMGVGARVLGGDELLQAVREAVLTSGVFERVLEEGRADYLLSVAVVSIEKSEPGLDMSARVELRWSLRRTRDGAILWERTLASESETDDRDADFIEDRGRMAIEGAVRDNLSQGIARIAALEL